MLFGLCGVIGFWNLNIEIYSRIFWGSATLAEVSGIKLLVSIAEEELQTYSEITLI